VESIAIHSSTPRLNTVLPTKKVSTYISTNQARSLTNGENIAPPSGETGLGTLKVINGTHDDAAIKLVDRNSGKTHRFVYLRANRDITLKGIASCLCTLKFSTGNDWNSRSRKFLRNSFFSQFDQVLDFREVRTTSSVQWMTYTATLHPVTHGNARTSSIRERDF
jgi:hypothetical protein